MYVAVCHMLIYKGVPVSCSIACRLPASILSGHYDATSLCGVLGLFQLGLRGRIEYEVYLIIMDVYDDRNRMMGLGPFSMPLRPCQRSCSEQTMQPFKVPVAWMALRLSCESKVPTFRNHV
jgi:hypothetical protein